MFLFATVENAATVSNLILLTFFGLHGHHTTMLTLDFFANPYLS